MKINQTGGTPLSGLGNAGGIRPGSGSKISTGGPGGTSSAPDSVLLSNLSSSLKAAMGDSATRLKKLSALAAAALSGGYQVDAGVVSGAIIRHSLQFGGAKYL